MVIRYCIFVKSLKNRLMGPEFVRVLSLAFYTAWDLICLFIYLFIYLFSSFLLLSNSVEPTHIGMHFFGQERISEAPQTQRCNCSSAGHYPALTVPGVNSKHHHMHHTHTHTPLHPTKMTGTLPPWGEKMTDFRLQTRSHMVLFTFCLPTLRLLLLDSLLNSI